MKKEQLNKAARQYERIDEINRTTTAGAPTREADKRYQKLAALRRGDCAYELGAYADAVKWYDAVAKRWSDDPVALAASVQVVNAYVAQGKLDEARAANEQARLLLSKLPQDALSRDGGFVMPRAYWEQWLKWTGVAAASTW
jgi:tetratricopeptide (TPR) repeat protein